MNRAQKIKFYSQHTSSVQIKKSENVGTKMDHFIYVIFDFVPENLKA